MPVDDTEVGPVARRDDETVLSRVAVPWPAPLVLPAAVDVVASLTGGLDAGRVGIGPALAATVATAAEDQHSFGRYAALFGRDSLQVARILGPQFPSIQPATFVALASHQGLPRDRAPLPDEYQRRLEAPGRIPHEVRDPNHDPIARDLVRRRGWAFPYFHSDDVTPTFVRDLARMELRQPGVLEILVEQRDGVTRSLSDVLGAATKHVLGSIGGDGLIESVRPARNDDPSLPAYPVWQDSPDAYFRVNGNLATGPVAALEVQLLAFDALTTAALIADRRHAVATVLPRADALRAAAAELRASVLAFFWTRGEVGGFASGVERVGSTLNALGGRRSVMGHALDSAMFDGPASAPIVDAIVHQLFEPDLGLVTPWGIRTLAADASHDRARPSGYHNGQIWPWDNHVIAMGLRRHGWNGLAAWLDERVIATCEALRCYPECIRGDSEAEPLVNRAVVEVEVADVSFGTFRHRVVQPPQPFQAWTVAGYMDAQWSLHRYDRIARTGSQARAEAHLLGRIADLGPSVDGGISAPTRGTGEPGLAR